MMRTVNYKEPKASVQLDILKYENSSFLFFYTQILSVCLSICLSVFLCLSVMFLPSVSLIKTHKACCVRFSELKERERERERKKKKEGKKKSKKKMSALIYLGHLKPFCRPVCRFTCRAGATEKAWHREELT